MKQNALIMVAAAICSFSCNKSSVSPGSNPGAGGGGGNPGSLTIASISPVNPYPDEEITITGTGFNTDKTKDTVEFGDVSNGGFKAWHDGLESEWPSLAAVISATSTQLVIKAGNPRTMDFYAFNKPGWPPQNPSPPSVGGIQVRTGGLKAQTAAISFKRYMALNTVHDEDGSDLNGRPNDSLVITGEGIDTTGVTFSIGNKAIIPATMSHNNNHYTFSLRLPKNFFGYENDESVKEDLSVTVQNADGRKEQLDCSFYQSPKMHVTSMSTNLTSYKLSAGGTIILDIKGVCLKDDTSVEIKSPNGYSSGFPLLVSDFQDNVTISLGNVTSLGGVGSYTINLKRNNGIVGACSFNIGN